MTLSGKRVFQTSIKSDADVFHALWKSDPHQIPNLTPTTIQNCQIHDGAVGTVGSILFWNYFHDGKDCVAKTLIQDIDEEKKSITFKVIEGDFLKLYKTFIAHLHVDTKGTENLVTWTIEYEKLNNDVPDPDTLGDLYTKITKDIENHHLKN